MPRWIPLLLLALVAAGCAATTPAPQVTPTPASRHYATAQQIVDQLRASGISTTDPKNATKGTYLETIGGTSWNVRIADEKKPSGINLFPNEESVKPWLELSKSFGGIAVVGDTWAVSLSTDTEDRQLSMQLVSRISAALGGEVQR